MEQEFDFMLYMKVIYLYFQWMYGWTLLLYTEKDNNNDV